nr:spore wall protein 2-like [Lolium perenne]
MAGAGGGAVRASAREEGDGAGGGLPGSVEVDGGGAEPGTDPGEADPGEDGEGDAGVVDRSGDASGEGRAGDAGGDDRSGDAEGEDGPGSVGHAGDEPTGPGEAEEVGLAQSPCVAIAS